MFIARSKILQRVLMVLVIICGVALLTTILSIRSWYKPSIHLGEVSPVTIILDRDVEVEDRVSTNEAREKARLDALKNVGNREVLQVDNDAIKKSVMRLAYLVMMVRKHFEEDSQGKISLNPSISSDTQEYLLALDDEKFNQVILSTDISETISALKPKLGPDLLGNKDLETLIIEELSTLNDIERKYFFDELGKVREDAELWQEEKNALGKTFFDGVSRIAADDREVLFRNASIIQKKLLDLGIVHGSSKSKIRKNIKILYPNLAYRNLIEKLIDRSVIPNLRLNWEKVHELEEEAMAEIKPVMINLKQGALLATKGERVEDQNYFYLKDMNFLHAKTDWKEIMNNLYLIAGIVISIALYLFVSGAKRYSLQQVLTMFLVPVSVSAIFAPIAIWGVDKLPLAPVATISILLTVFYAPTMAAIIVTVICFFLAKSVDMNFWQVLPHWVGSLYAILLVRKAHQREDLTNAGTKIAFAQVATFLATVIVAVEDFQVLTVLIVGSFYGLSAIASGFISLAALPYLETGLKLLSPFRLAELSNPNQPILKRLKEEAPGTYEHSLNVSRLSEEAGQLLGLNTELIRVGLLYHDIGKLHAPDYFIENTLGKPNPHTTLDDPYQSAKIIVDHVPEGVKLARKHNLPQAIVDFIPMHQGTTITNYFYHQAVERDGKKSVDKELFRYPGPKPHSKETGVAMIADSSEAALRSIKDLANEEAAREMIYKIINSRLDEGELDETGLTRSDLDKVANGFLEVWRSQNHERVKYPKEV